MGWCAIPECIDNVHPRDRLRRGRGWDVLAVEIEDLKTLFGDSYLASGVFRVRHAVSDHVLEKDCEIR